MSTRIGLIVPSSNTVCEPDFYTRLPRRLHAAHGPHVPRGDHAGGRVGDARRARPPGDRQSRDGASRRGRVRLHQRGRSTRQRVRGRADRADLRTRPVRRRSAWPHRCGARSSSQKPDRVGVITPYVDSLNEKIRESLEADGVSVTAIHGLGIDENFTIAEVQPERIVELRLRVLLARRHRSAVRVVHELPCVRRSRGARAGARRSGRDQQPGGACNGTRRGRERSRPRSRAHVRDDIRLRQSIVLGRSGGPAGAAGRRRPRDRRRPEPGADDDATDGRADRADRHRWRCRALDRAPRRDARAVGAGSPRGPRAVGRRSRPAARCWPRRAAASATSGSATAARSAARWPTPSRPRSFRAWRSPRRHGPGAGARTAGGDRGRRPVVTHFTTSLETAEVITTSSCRRCRAAGLVLPRAGPTRGRLRDGRGRGGGDARRGWRLRDGARGRSAPSATGPSTFRRRAALSRRADRRRAPPSAARWPRRSRSGRAATPASTTGARWSRCSRSRAARGRRRRWRHRGAEMSAHRIRLDVNGRGASCGSSATSRCSRCCARAAPPRSSSAAARAYAGPARCCSTASR